MTDRSKMNKSTKREHTYIERKKHGIENCLTLAALALALGPRLLRGGLRPGLRRLLALRRDLLFSF